MIPEIKQGMKIKCLKCGKAIKLTEKTFQLDCLAEYIICPHCGVVYDVQVYHKYGEIF